MYFLKILVYLHKFLIYKYFYLPVLKHLVLKTFNQMTTSYKYERTFIVDESY